jgi:hypothetical protein
MEQAGECFRKARQKHAHFAKAEAKTTDSAAWARCAQTVTASAKLSFYKLRTKRKFYGGGNVPQPYVVFLIKNGDFWQSVLSVCLHLLDNCHLRH